MPTRSNEQLCRLAQAGDTAARDILLESNLGFIRKIALEQYRSMGLDENDIGIDLDDLVQEGSISLLNAIPLFDAERGMKFLTYAAPAIRNAMTDCIRAALAQFEQRMVDKRDGPGFQRVYLDDVLSDDERMLRIEAIADPHTKTPEQIYIQKEQLTELYAALDKLTAREQTYLLYRYGQPFPPERRNCSHTFRGVLHFRLPSAPQRYNTLDFPTENRVPRNRRFLWILPVKGERYPL